MILTITANTTMDQTVFIPSLIPNTTIRATQTAHSMGGKPTDASWILGKMGIPSIAVGFKAGGIGDKIESMLNSREVQTDFVPVGGESRMNVIIIAEAQGSHTTITTSTLDVTEAQIQTLYDKVESYLPAVNCVVLGGTLPKAVPPSFYTDVIRQIRQHDIPVIFDADEPNLSAGLQSSPTYIKPNEHELSRLTGRDIQTLDDAYHAGREIIDKYGTSPIVTLGERGSLAVLPDKTYRIHPIAVEVVSPAGAGDGMLAGLALALDRGESIEEGLIHGTTFATAILNRLETAEYNLDDIAPIREQVQIEAY